MLIEARVRSGDGISRHAWLARDGEQVLPFDRKAPRCWIALNPSAWTLSLFVGLAALSNGATAHHSYAMFDQTRRVSITGTVRALEWTNPHVWVWVDVDDGKGGAVPYGFEAQAPSELQRFFGWTNASVKSGDRVTVHYAPLRSGKNGGALQTLELADGRRLLTGRSNPPSTAAGGTAQPGAPQ